MANKFIALIPCAGSSTRFGGDIPKQYVTIAGKTILEHTLGVFISLEEVSSIVLIAAMNDSYINSYKNLSDKISIKKVGGKTRAETVLNGLNSLECSDDDWVLVHDAARCCIKSKIIKKLIDELGADDVGGILAVGATDTIKKANDGIIIETLKRENIYLAQTPQMFRYGILKKSLNNKLLTEFTDEASAVEQLGYLVKIIQSDSANIKVTYPLDLLFAEVLLSNKY